jgi:hypothetical protein
VLFFTSQDASIRHPDFSVKHCAYVHSVATLLNPRGVTTVSHKYSLAVARHGKVVVAVPSIVLKIKFKSVNKLFAIII